MKTDFSDWLIVSDVDGTLNTKLRMLPERNLKAITHFVEDLGGNFTLPEEIYLRSESTMSACR